MTHGPQRQGDGGMLGTNELMRNAWKPGTVIPAFNIPYLPMMGAVVRALQETGCVGLIAVARPDLEEFGAGGIGPIRDEYARVEDQRATRLHLERDDQPRGIGSTR
jgi:fructose-bisphosphate aldolase class II